MAADQTLHNNISLYIYSWHVHICIHTRSAWDTCMHVCCIFVSYIYCNAYTYDTHVLCLTWLVCVRIMSSVAWAVPIMINYQKKKHVHMWERQRWCASTGVEYGYESTKNWSRLGFQGFEPRYLQQLLILPWTKGLEFDQGSKAADCMDFGWHPPAIGVR